MKRFAKGHYLLDNGFEVVRNDYSFSQVQWVICHEDYDTLQEYLDQGYDQCFFTLREAREYMSGLTLENMTEA